MIPAVMGGALINYDTSSDGGALMNSDTSSDGGGSNKL